MRPITGRLPQAQTIRTTHGSCSSAVAMSTAAISTTSTAAMSGVCAAESRLFGYLIIFLFHHKTLMIFFAHFNPNCSLEMAREGRGEVKRR